MSRDEFDLMAELERIVAETSLADPGEIADKIAENMTRAQLVAFAKRHLREWVRLNLGRLRVSPNRARAGKRNSAKRRDGLTRMDIAERLSGRFAYNGVDWGITGELTADQCREIAGSYGTQARFLLDREVEWAALADEMVKRKARRVRDLPADVLAAFFQIEPPETGAAA